MTAPYTLAIDPGRKGLGWSLFTGSALLRCGVVPPLKAPRAYTQPDLGLACKHAASHVYARTETHIAHVQAVIERMRHYPGTRAADAKANDLLDLQAIGAYVAGRLSTLPPVYLSPGEWKGSTQKRVSQARILAVLTDDERALIPTGAKAHNAIDAIGIGLRYLGRL